MEIVSGKDDQVWVFEEVDVDDKIKPTTPTNLMASNITGTGFQLSWEPSTDNVGVERYQLFRAGKCIMNNIAAPTNAVYVTGIDVINCGSTGSYKLRARDASVNFSGYCEILKVTNPPWPDYTPPTVLLNLVASDIGENSVQLGWE